MGRLFVFLFLFAIVAFCSDYAFAHEGVSKIFSKYNTYNNSKYLNENYVFQKTLKYSDKKAFVVTYSNPTEKNRRYFRYLFVSLDGEFLYEISVGSYETTTLFSREKGNIGPDERLYHVDLYCPSEPNENGVSSWKSHYSMGFLRSLPDFESFTQKVLEKEEGKSPCQNTE